MASNFPTCNEDFFNSGLQPGVVLGVTASESFWVGLDFNVLWLVKKGLLGTENVILQWEIRDEKKVSFLLEGVIF
ncbi:hypothetical protein RJT34_13969 [Clitoria ternatea]|uniref:Uncharacterized protein n=1 Tax=Clitoria ternatea TaxID=43366 RepID=A0AAN9JPJ1_CLITE